MMRPLAHPACFAASARATASLALAFVMLGSAGCGAGRFVGLGRPNETAPPASVAAAKPERPRKTKQAKARDDGEPNASNEAKPKREPKVKAAKEKKKNAERPSDPLAEAKLRADEQPAEPWWPYRVAVLESKDGHREASEAAFRSSLAREPGYAPALTRLSQMLYEQGRYAEGVQLLAPVRDGSVVLDEEDRSAAIAGLALHEAALGREDRARAAMGPLGRDGRDGAIGVAAYLAVRGTSSDSALRITESAVRAAPKSAANHNNRGIALLRSADPDAAEKEFERAIELDPSLPGPYYNLAILERFYRLDTPAASRHFQKYWSRSHADPDSLYAELGRGKPAPVAEEGNPK